MILQPVAFTLVALATLSAAAQGPALYQLPEAKRVKLPNGLVLLLLEKHDLPLTSITLALRTGTLEDPAGKPGVSALTEEELRRGTESRTAGQLAQQIDFLGMTLGGGGGRGGGGGGSSYDETDLSADFLSRDTDKALALMADVVLHPVFPADELAKAIAQRQERLKTEKDDAQTAVSRYFLTTLYAGHPYARAFQTTTEASLGLVTRDDLVGFYHRVYTPANAVIAVAGDFNSTEMEAKLKSLFGSWKGAAPASIPVPALKPVTGRHVLLIDKPDATQTYFIVGNVGISETDPDRGPVRVVNTLFGGRFTSLFNTELRIKSGYSYGANSSFSQLRTPGPFLMTTYTRNATTGPAIDKTLEVLTHLHAHPFTEADLTSAKNYIRGTFPTTLETTPALAQRLATDEVEGISRQQFNAELAAEQATTLAEANHVIDKDFPANENYVMVIVGKASEIAPIAAKYGTVTTKKITDPGY